MEKYEFLLEDRIAKIQAINNEYDLEKNGYPFKSKEHSLRVEQFNKGLNSNYIKKYITGYDKDGKPSKFICPKILMYQFNEKGRYNFSNKCCYKLKKEPIHKWEKQNKRSIGITGMRAEEGGNRARLGCTIFKGSKLYHFHPLIVVSEEWEEEFIEKEKIILCKLYYPPYNFRRTGCRACPYAIELQKELEKLKAFMPHEYKAAELLWKPVYDEYRRIGYRLKKEVNYQYNIFDFKESK